MSIFINNTCRFKPRFSLLGNILEMGTYPLVRATGSFFRFYSGNSKYAREKGKDFKAKLILGEKLYLIGLGPSGHNSAAALVSVDRNEGIRVICNNEEERYTGIKNDGHFPVNSLADVFEYMKNNQIDYRNIFAVLGSWDYLKGISTGLRHVIEEAPQSFSLIRRSASPHMNFWHFVEALKAPSLLKSFFKSKNRIPFIGMRHHNNHAFYPYAVSPFAGSKEPTIIIVMDGFGDDGSISFFCATDNKIDLIGKNKGVFDSQGLLYAVISSTQGGWEPLSSEGRYMGASAWGDMDRLTNPFYKRLRQIIHFESGGQVLVNRSMIKYHQLGQQKPYGKKLKEILGDPIPPDKIWNPDMVLNVDNIEHAEITRERVDKAAALQLVYEDALFHMVDYLIRLTKSNQLILSGGTALNCVANMKLMDHFNEDYYLRSIQRKETTLKLWVPPNPSDTGTAMGACYHFALLNGSSCGSKMNHAFICGNPPRRNQIRMAMEDAEDTRFHLLGNINCRKNLLKVADLIAFIISRNGVVGLYQGAGETGPRALGHRSILANPCNPDSLDQINELVKFREKIRPLAPMITLNEAKRYFYLAKGASSDNFNAYNYMVLTVMAKEAAFPKIPAVIHKDGTSRIQICREETDPLSFEVLKAIRRYIGVEALINTSLNVGTPIVNSPDQAIRALHRSKGLSGLIMVEENGEAYLCWHNIISGLKDGGNKLNSWVREWYKRQEKIEIKAADIKQRTF
jgi:carbamoyltransferase